MFPLTINSYVKIITGVLVVFAIWGAGFGLGYSRLTKYKLEQETKAAQIETQYQAAADQIRKQKDDQIASINAQLADALVQLHNRPSRPTQTNIGQSGTGMSLYAEDAAFLDREAARADVLRTALQACYAQYDAIK